MSVEKLQENYEVSTLLKAEDVASEEDEYVPINVSSVEDNGSTKLGYTCKEMK